MISSSLVSVTVPSEMPVTTRPVSVWVAVTVSEEAVPKTVRAITFEFSSKLLELSV